MTSTFLTLRVFIFGVNAVLTYGDKCGPSEYLSTAGECCPMCNIGSVIHKDCHGDYSTACKPCSRGTFMNEPNGLHNCFQCKTCDTGLYILQSCTTIKNTVCEVLDGYYCLEYSDGECSLAVKHSECKPGQQIKTPGTKDSDTVCEPCPPGFYSPEGVNCSKWTDCSVNNEIEDQEGTTIRDVKCKPRGVNADLTYGAKCGPSEYLSAAGECCPMCNIGLVVSKDCHGDYRTTCKPCSRGTFMNEPNGLHNCFSCKTCDTGLYIFHNCTTIKNTVCEVLGGYYCLEYSDGECSLAVKHSECKPGQQIKTPGTKDTDTVCEPCPPGFYSPEGVNCSKWTDCSVNNEIEDQEGTTIRDVKCKPRGVNADPTYGAKCGPSEYLSAAGECCPMCNIGSVVYKDCHGDYSTTCKPCSRGTFMNEPNGLHSCFSCKTCDTGLYTLQSCTTIKNTVCEVLDGYYCLEYSDGECSLAVKHSECKPGKQIKTPGTKDSDTVCECCPPRFYSPDGVICYKWTDCSANNEIEDQRGTSIRDVKCKPRGVRK